MGKKIKCLSTNNGGEFCNQEFDAFVVKKAYNDKRLLLTLHNKMA